MIYYIALIILILVLHKKATNISTIIYRNLVETKYSYVIWFVIILMAALRSPMVGADTPAYISDYIDMSNADFAWIRDRYEGYLGYYYTSKVFSMIGASVQVWFGFVEALYACALFLFIKRFSKDKIFSILIFVTVGLFSFSLAGLKQVMSMSFMIFAFLSFLDKRYFWSILMAFVGFQCHSAGLIFLGVIPLYIIRGRKYFISIVVISAIAMVVYSEMFLSIMVDQLGNEHYEAYLERDESYTSVKLIFYIILITLTYLGYKRYYQADANNAKYVFGLSVIVCAFQALSSVSPNMFRLAICYAPFLMVLIPNTCYYYKNRGVTFSIISITIFFFLYVSRNTPYSFFWEF